VTEEERRAYATRMVTRLSGIIHNEGLTLPEWEHRNAADMLLEAIGEFEVGGITKEELDSKAIGYLQDWREHGTRA